MEQVLESVRKADAPVEEKRAWTKRFLDFLDRPFSTKVLGGFGQEVAIGLRLLLENELGGDA